MANNRFTNLRKAKKPAIEPELHTELNHEEQEDNNLDSTFERTSGEVPKRGRPRAKRSSDDFAQATAYVRKETYIEVKHKLLDQKKEYSVLVQELLDQWLRRQN